MNLRSLTNRCIMALLTLLLGSIVIFTLIRILPGDDVAVFISGAGATGHVATPEELAGVRQKLGLDKPLAVQYATWVVGLLEGDMGTSYFRSGMPIAQTIIEKGWLTAQIAVLGMIFAWILAVPLGVISAVRRNSLVDYACRVVAVLGMSVPNFWLAVLVVVFLAQRFKWSTPLRYSAPWDDPLTNLQQVLLPSVVLAVPLMGTLARLVRSSVLDVMGEDFVRTARVKGLRERVVITRHVLKIALLPAVSLSSVGIGLILGSTVVIEKVFAVDGLGNALLQAVVVRDSAVVQNVLLIFVAAFIVINLITDVVYSWLDPRIRFG
jgi:peptide/nickel transport system permease protein